MEAGLWWDSLEHQSLISPSRKSIAVYNDAYKYSFYPRMIGQLQ